MDNLDFLAGLKPEDIENLPEEVQRKIAEQVIAAIPGTPDEIFAVIDKADKQRLGKIARENYSPEGFFSFYEVIFEREPPEHVKNWIRKHFVALAKKMNTLIEAFRGSTKSTTVIAYLAWFIGHNPTLTNLVIGSGDDDANEIVDMVAAIVEKNPGWKTVFPNVVRDRNEGASWGSNSGYDVVDTSMDYGEFSRDKQKEGRASSIKGVGYKSKYLPGPHPTGLLIVDDIYNYDSSMSEAELNRIEQIYNGTILPMKEPETIHFLIGTPWREDDIIAKKKRSNKYLHIFTPIALPDGTPVWPEKYDKKAIEDKREELDDDVQFELMYMLNINVLQGLVLKRTSLRWYDYQKIVEYGNDWVVLIGVDYTSTEDPTRRNVDYFALAVGKMMPGNIGVVVVDGIRMRLDQAEAEGMVVQWCAKYPFLQELGIEAIITGKEFHNMMLTNMALVRSGIVPTALRGGIFQKSKGYRFEKILQPAFKKAQIYLSDIYKRPEAPVEEHTKDFFEAFEDEWAHWQGDKGEKLYHNDTIDAIFNVYWMASQYFDLAAMEDEDRRRATNPMYLDQNDQNNHKDFLRALSGNKGRGGVGNSFHKGMTGR
ncbi:hypothetical protein KQH61_06015 [bacterium]|nr:hypothetical protein [bacterium]